MMRSTPQERLMSRRTFSKDGTVKLQWDFIESNKRYDRILVATPLNPLMWFRKDNKEKKLSQKLDEIENQLADRYEGIMLQMLRKANTANDTSVRLIWSLARTKALLARDKWAFPRVLWESYKERVDLDDSMASVLRPKFMLRQFVDEIENSAHRDVLRALAYGGGNGSGEFTKETFNMFNSALDSLHKELLQQSSSVDHMTDRTLRAGEIKTFRKPFVEYRDWLIKC
jgi:hypothetical protein